MRNVGVMHVGGPAGTRGAFSLYVPEYYDARDCLSAGRGDAWRQRQWRRLPVELGARGAHAGLHRDRADGHRLDLVADGARRRRAQHRPHGRACRGRMEHRCDAQAADRHERRRHLHLCAGPARRLPLHPSGADRGGVSSHADELRRCRPRARPADPDRAWRAGLDVLRPSWRGTPSRRWPQAGADVVYREIADLSHTYPRDENGPYPRLVPGESRVEHHRKRRQGPLRRAARHPDAGGALSAHPGRHGQRHDLALPGALPDREGRDAQSRSC